MEFTQTPIWREALDVKGKAQASMEAEEKEERKKLGAAIARAKKFFDDPEVRYSDKLFEDIAADVKRSSADLLKATMTLVSPKTRKECQEAEEELTDAFAGAAYHCIRNKQEGREPHTHSIKREEIVEASEYLAKLVKYGAHATITHNILTDESKNSSSPKVTAGIEIQSRKEQTSKKSDTLLDKSQDDCCCTIMSCYDIEYDNREINDLFHGRKSADKIFLNMDEQKALNRNVAELDFQFGIALPIIPIITGDTDIMQLTLIPSEVMEQVTTIAEMIGNYFLD